MVVNITVDVVFMHDMNLYVCMKKKTGDDRPHIAHQHQSSIIHIHIYIHTLSLECIPMMINYVYMLESMCLQNYYENSCWWLFYSNKNNNFFLIFSILCKAVDALALANYQENKREEKKYFLALKFSHLLNVAAILNHTVMAF